MKPLAKNLVLEKGYAFHGDRMNVVDVVPRYEIKIRLEQHVNRSVAPVNRSLYNQMYWNNYPIGWRIDETSL